MKSVKMILSRLYSQIHKREKYGETTLKIWKKYGEKRKNTEKHGKITMKIRRKYVENTEQISCKYGKIR